MTVLIHFASLTHTGPGTGSEVFPYGIACVAAHAKARFGDAVDCEVFSAPADFNAALERTIPDVLCLSNYTWNKYLALAFAEEVKARRPQTVVVMGGPNISVTPEGRREFLETNGSVDFYIKWDGELAFAELFEALMAHDLDATAMRATRAVLPNCLYLAGDDYIEGPDSRVPDLDAMPSPYTMGLLDKFFADGTLSPLTETTRGCPYGCTFCVDSHISRNKITRRTPANLREEFTYIAKRVRKLEPLTMADLNFGMYREDLDTAEIIDDLIVAYGWPRTIITALGKSQPDRIMEVVRKINAHEKGVIRFAASFQSTDAEVLDHIKRKNLSVDKIRSVLHSPEVEADSKDMFGELILGLPADSFEKHMNSIRACIDEIGMNFLNVHQLSLLQGSPMALPSERQRYGFDTRYRVFPGRIGTYEMLGKSRPVAEVEEVVVANNTLSFDEWAECRIINLLVKIYVDHDTFVEVLGLVRQRGGSVLDMLLELRRNHRDGAPGLKAVIARYMEMATEKLFPTLDAFLASVADPETMPRYMSGEFGGNEMIVSRAEAYSSHGDELHAVLLSAAKAYLAGKGLLDAQAEQYLDEAVRFSRLRKFDIHSYRDDLEDTFHFDFVSAKRERFRVDPADLEKREITIRFCYTPEQRSNIEKVVGSWLGDDVGRAGESGRSKFALGRFYQKFNLNTLSREAQTV